MIEAETFVGTLAILLALVGGVVAVGPIDTALKLRIVRVVRQRGGEGLTRLFVAAVASVLLLSGVMILRDVRPSFALPLSGKAPINLDAANQ